MKKKEERRKKKDKKENEERKERRITEEERKEKRFFKTHVIRLVISRRKDLFLEGIRLVSAFGESRDLVLTPSRSDLVVQSSRFAVLVGSREILKLGTVSGPVL